MMDASEFRVGMAVDVYRCAACEGWWEVVDRDTILRGSTVFPNEKACDCETPTKHTGERAAVLSNLAPYPLGPTFRKAEPTG